MNERFNQAYIAVPIKESPLLSLVKSINEHKKFFHMTFYFLGEIDEAELDSVRNVIINKPDHLKNFILTPEKLDLIGIHSKTHVLRIKETNTLFEFRSFLEENLPNFKANNLPFQPHITIKGYDKSRIPSSVVNKKLQHPVEAYEAASIGIYYKTEEGATALLYSHKNH